jgi:hypothetical protein
MMRYAWRLVPVSCVLVGFGCKGETQADRDAKDPAVYARMIKQDVQQFVQDAKQNPRTLKDQASIFLEKLEAHTSQPVGDNGPIYEQLTQKCKELVEAASRLGDARKKLDEMAALAKKLPD